MSKSLKLNKKLEAKLEAIAKKNGLRDDLKTRNQGWMDFKETAVWSLRAALAEAYEAGRQSVTKETK